MSRKSTTVITPEIVEDKVASREFFICLPDSQSTMSRMDIIALGQTWHRTIEGNIRLADNYRRKALFGILKLGEFLSKVRSKCPLGEWSKLFSDSDKNLVEKGNRKRVSDLKKTNEKYVSHFEFTVRTANNYIKAYEASLQNLKETERKTFAALPYNDQVAAPEAEKLVEKATKGAETMTQMYLNLGVIKPREATHITNFKGGKAGAEANVRIREELANVDPAEEEKQDPQELHDQAMRDGNELLRLLERFVVTEKEAEHLTSGERDALSHAVVEYGKRIKNSNYQMKL